MRPRRQQRSRLRRVAVRVVVLVALAAFLGSFAAVLLLSVGRGESPARRAQPVRPVAAPRPRRPPVRKPVVKPKPKKPKAVPRPLVRLVGVAAYDPKGDGHEKDELVAQATDRDPATYWTTETYSTWGWKPGVGIVLDAGRPVRLTQLTLVSDTPGFTAQIQAGASTEGPFRAVSAKRVVGRATVFPLAERTPARYRLVWITQLGPKPTDGGAVHVNEVRARG